MFKVYFLCLFVFVTSLANATPSETEKNALLQQARALTKSFAGQLKQQLQAGMHEGGPMQALDVCNVEAPAIAEAVGDKSGWHVARTSLKTRQENNRPEEWELLTLLDFEKQKDAGVKLTSLEHYEFVENQGQKEFRYMKAIPTGQVCLACHGEHIKPEVAHKIDKLYPMDQALDFKAGDIRGAFTLRKTLD